MDPDDTLAADLTRDVRELSAGASPAELAELTQFLEAVCAAFDALLAD